MKGLRAENVYDATCDFKVVILAAAREGSKGRQLVSRAEVTSLLSGPSWLQTL